MALMGFYGGNDILLSTGRPDGLGMDALVLDLGFSIGIADSDLSIRHLCRTPTLFFIVNMCPSSPSALPAVSAFHARR